ncbi:hypothetical protein [Bosea sp. BK604]|uniref:hypothetical protein n=1 Tax=Bosea sp. BK604 TaxID=2512180 RepID=UPI001046AB24|nr:hypothetical protein [Bosea sp. BK604]
MWAASDSPLNGSRSGGTGAGRLSKVPDEAASTRCGGNGFVVFFGMAKPVRTPVIGSQVRRW